MSFKSSNSRIIHLSNWMVLLLLLLLKSRAVAKFHPLKRIHSTEKLTKKLLFNECQFWAYPHIYSHTHTTNIAFHSLPGTINAPLHSRSWNLTVKLLDIIEFQVAIFLYGLRFIFNELIGFSQHERNETKWKHSTN